MEHDGRGKPPPGELSSFDISKRGGADVAAELAKRMATWRNARKGQAARTSRQPTDVTTAVPAETFPVNRPTLPSELDAAMVTRIDRALRMAIRAPAPKSEIVWPTSRQAQAHSTAFKGLLADGANPRATGLKPERRLALALRYVHAIGLRIKATVQTTLQVHASHALQSARAIATAARRSSVAAWHAWGPALGRFANDAQRHIRTIGAAAWHTRTDRVVIAGATAIGVAIVGWFLVRTEPPVAPESPRWPEVSSARDALVTPAADQLPSRQQAVVADTPAPEGRASDFLPAGSLGARVPPRLKPPVPAPALVARLKPPDASMLSAEPQTTPSMDGDASSGRGDPRATDSALDRMLGDGLSR